MLRFVGITAWLLVGCSETGFSEDKEPQVEPAPHIEADPVAIDFGVVDQGQASPQTLRLINVGDAPLTISEHVLGMSSAFEVNAVWPVTVEPGDATLVEVVYTATNVIDEGWVVFLSDDPDDPELTVPLTGGTALPELIFEPQPLDLPAMMRTCPISDAINMVNVGAAPLTVESVDVSGEGFSIEELLFPIVIPPGGRVPIEIEFIAQDERLYEGLIRGYSDDPRGPQLGHFTGFGEALVQRVDVGYQIEEDWTQVDMLFYVDQSGSMDGDQTNLSNNFDYFTDTLVSEGIDYHVMVATQDNGCHNGEIITPATDNAELVFDNAVRGGGGGLTEAGLSVAAAALSKTDFGECNDGFRRADAPLTVVLVSDEPEQSPSGSFAALNDLLAEEPNAMVHAIVGQPGGSCAEPGTGYWEAADLTGGASLDICAPDWGTHFDTITNLPEPIDTFPLTADPLVETIRVTTNGAVAYGWIYDEPLNAIVFLGTGLPAPGSEVRISYDEVPVCPE